jgi:hypothetical protein
MFSGTGELEVRGSLLVYRDRINGTLIYWYGARAPRAVGEDLGCRRHAIAEATFE